MKLSKTYWSDRYKNAETGWDIGYPSPVFVEYFKSVENKEVSILIPGAGNAYEAEYLFQQGFSPTVLDWSTEPLGNLKKRIPEYPSTKLIQADFFSHEGEYDYILEQTFFCALPLAQRVQYAQKMHSLLKPNGKLLGVLFNTVFETESPPFGGTIEEYKNLFSSTFNNSTFETCRNSILPRVGKELFFTITK